MRRALTVLLALLAAAPAASAATSRLDIDRSGPVPVISDAEGRQVTLRGINVNQLGDYFQADPKQRTTFPLTGEDFAQIASLGFDHVRLVLSWSALQPARGAFDAGYLQRIRTAVAQAEQQGLRVVLDMHQDAWGKFVATKPGETCPPGLGPAVGWDGAPEWATLTDGMTTCRAAGTRELSPAVAQAFQSFYLDRDGIQTELVQTWARLAAAFATDPGVIGYDLLNEPHPGLLIGPDQSAALGRYYAAAIDSIRAAETKAGGFPHLVFFEPSVVWSGFGTDATPPPGFTSDRRIVFAPHLYAESITVDQQAGINSVSIEQGFDAAEQTADRYDAPLWVGEWGWFGDPAKDRPKMDRFNRQEEQRLIGGSAFWVWRQACGDPHTVGYSGAAGALNRLQCPGDRPLGLARPFTEALGRAYPRAAPGRLTQLQSDAAARRFALRGSDPAAAGSCRLEVWFPGDAEPALQGTGLSDLRTERVDGGWLVTACARSEYALSGRPGVKPLPASAKPCRSRRVIRITARRPESGVRRVRVRASLGRLRVRGRRITLDLRGRPRARVVVTITVIARDGSRLVDRRAYRTCTPGT